ncbi:MAG: lysylphosphatidylglycerol synthase transmembrane domain-containing protein [Myxococcota bacterium]
MSHPVPASPVAPAPAPPSSSPPKPKRGARGVVVQLLKLGLVGGLLYVLVQKGFLSLDKTREAFTRPLPMVAGMLLLVSTSLASAFRWQLLLRAQSLVIPFSRTVQLQFIGLFFNIALPGAVSGDFVKAFYVGQEAPERRARTFGSILFDRVLGLSALMVVSSLAMLLGSNFTGDATTVGALKLLVHGMAAGVVGFYAYLFLVNPERDLLLKLLTAIHTRIPRLAAITGVYEGMRHYHHHRGTVLRALGLSAVIHLTVGVAFLFFSRAMGEGQLALHDLYTVVPTGLLITTIPVAPVGVGTGHAAFLFLFRLLGSERGADIFTLMVLTQFLIGAVGGLVYLRFRSHEPAPTPTPG